MQAKNFGAPLSGFLLFELQSIHAQQSVHDIVAPKLSPSVIVIIALITVVFFLSGLLHLLAKCYSRYSQRNDIIADSTLQGQLQHLFHLHDSGVEQAFIDALPIFFYKSVRGLKDGADCAVCLSEFQGEDRLRLLPNCSHAFHLDCIDTWLLTHSTCPLCRRSLLPDVVAAAGIDTRNLQIDALTGGGISETSVPSNLSGTFIVEIDAAMLSAGEEEGSSGEIQPDKELDYHTYEKGEERTFKLVNVKLGRFCPMQVGVGPKGDGRRSYSMGSYEYVINPSSLQVMIAPTPVHRRWANCKPPTPGHKSALSDFTRDQYGIEEAKATITEELFVSDACFVSPYRKHTRPLTSCDNVRRLNEVALVDDERPKTVHQAKSSTCETECSRRGDGTNDRMSCQRSADLFFLKASNPCGTKSMPSSFSPAHCSVYSSNNSNTIVEVPSSPTGSLQNGGVESRRHSIARKTLHWLMGRERRFVYPASNASATA